MEAFAELSQKISILSANILDVCQPERKLMVVRRQAQWNSVYDPENAVILEDLRLVNGLGGLALGRTLRYQSTERLTARLFGLTQDGQIQKIISNVEDEASLVTNISRFQSFVPNIYDYHQVITELEHGLSACF